MNTLSHHAREFSHPLAGIAHRLSRRLGSRSSVSRPPAASSVSLAKKEVHVLIDFNGGSIQCTGGCVWLTHDGDCRDVLLEAGQLHVSDRDSRLVIYALEPSAVRLVRPAARG